jgi:hypothetical protein
MALQASRRSLRLYRIQRLQRLSRRAHVARIMLILRSLERMPEVGGVLVVEKWRRRGVACSPQALAKDTVHQMQVK